MTVIKSAGLRFIHCYLHIGILSLLWHFFRVFNLRDCLTMLLDMMSLSCDKKECTSFVYINQSIEVNLSSTAYIEWMEVLTIE